MFHLNYRLASFPINLLSSSVFSSKFVLIIDCAITLLLISEILDEEPSWGTLHRRTVINFCAAISVPRGLLCPSSRSYPYIFISFYQYFKRRIWGKRIFITHTYFSALYKKIETPPAAGRVLKNRTAVDLRASTKLACSF